MTNIRIETEKEAFKAEYKRVYKALTNAKVPVNQSVLVLNELLFINELNKGAVLEAIGEMLGETE
ncbi:hypothetical protein AH03_17 [Erwinia phage AH03]|uniref:Uncharacterized protein n=1 Tax=Erwinia phage AH03 TaxID=2869568 RepID=A0AAE7X1F0_9CAUD|nr:hypothetical protein AH03_17 [Erwinia phage AH03]